MRTGKDKRKYVLVDFDGTLSNPKHRLKYISGKVKDFSTFYAKVKDDLPNHWCVLLVRALIKSGQAVIILTARPIKTRKDSYAWLEKHLGKNLTITIEHVRKDGVMRPDHLLKEDWLQMFGKDRVEFVIEDRTKVVEMWRSHRLTVLHCDKWEEANVTKPVKIVKKEPVKLAKPKKGQMELF